MEVLSTSLEGHSHGSRKEGEKKGVHRQVSANAPSALGVGISGLGNVEFEARDSLIPS